MMTKMDRMAESKMTQDSKNLDSIFLSHINCVNVQPGRKAVC
jgi:hypothetical protein